MGFSDVVLNLLLVSIDYCTVPMLDIHADILSRILRKKLGLYVLDNCPTSYGTA